MNSHQLFVKHFGDVGVVNTNHPNMEAFFSDLKEVCADEDKRLKFIPEDENLVCSPLENSPMFQELEHPRS